MKKILVMFFILTLSSFSFSQEKSTDEFSEAIEDNSFYIEEAYNQETHVVQHIFNGALFSKPEQEGNYSFTQEWPLYGQEHQLSVTIPSLTNMKGVGDIFVNYRYQLTPVTSSFVMAPRLSVLVPTNNASNGMGNGYWGGQINFPVSKRWSNEFVSHVNAGMTLLQNKTVILNQFNQNEEIKKTLSSFNIGASGIWLTSKNINVMLEISDNINNDLDASGDVITSNELIINPALRFAIDIQSLQIVPGIGIPFRITEDRTDIGIFLYLSFEHPY